MKPKHRTRLYVLVGLLLFAGAFFLAMQKHGEPQEIKEAEKLLKISQKTKPKNPKSSSEDEESNPAKVKMTFQGAFAEK